MRNENGENCLELLNKIHEIPDDWVSFSNVLIAALKYILFMDVDDSELSCSKYPWIGYIYYFVFGAIASLIVLNAIIAMMGTAQEETLEKSIAEYYRLRLEIIERFLLGLKEEKYEEIMKETKHFHMMKPSSLEIDEGNLFFTNIFLSKLKDQGNEWEGSMKKITHDIAKCKEKLDKDIKKVQETMQADIKKVQETMQADIKKVQDNVTEVQADIKKILDLLSKKWYWISPMLDNI